MPQQHKSLATDYLSAPFSNPDLTASSAGAQIDLTLNPLHLLPWQRMKPPVSHDLDALAEGITIAQDAQADAEHKLATRERMGRIAHYFTRTAAARNEITESRLADAEYMATHDPLTGLYNRAGLEKVINSYDGGTTGLLILDVANFKAMNDKFGHNNGDDALQQIAAILSGSVRPGDAVIRLGGDEFAILLNVDKEAARKAHIRNLDDPIADDQYVPRNECVDPEIAVKAVQANILERIGYVRAENEEWQASGMHLGVGATIWDPKTETVETAIGRADIALEKHKKGLHIELGQYRTV